MSFFALLLQQAYKELIQLSAMPVTIGRMAVACYNLNSHPPLSGFALVFPVKGGNRDRPYFSARIRIMSIC
jgi:hypothetical protein